jgi:hypothetical protein
MYPEAFGDVDVRQRGREMLRCIYGRDCYDEMERRLL